MKYYLQVFTGNAQSAGPAPDQVLSALGGACDRLEVEGVILGWSANRSLYQPLLAEIHRRGKTAWLWLPVFSDLPAAQQRESSITLDGRVQTGTAVIQGEDFAFVCPTSARNLENPLEIYRTRFAGLGFDGVFLDKIRHASFSGGLESALGCFCPRCRARYDQAGLDITALEARIGENPVALLPHGIDRGRLRFADSLLDGVYRCKAAWITQAVRQMAESFRGMGLGVGLDVYAPLFAYYVGQDVEALAKSADFVKPMLYRITHSPAGLPYEIRCMREALRPLGCDPLPVLQALWQEEDLTGEAAAAKQVSELAGVDCGLYPGFEINVVPEICESTPAYVTANKALYGGLGLPGAVLSWNLLADTGENLRALRHQQERC